MRGIESKGREQRLLTKHTLADFIGSVLRLEIKKDLLGRTQLVTVTTSALIRI